MTDERTTEERVTRAREGDRGAFDELVHGESAALRSFISSRLSQGLRRRVEPEDIAQETLLKAFERIGHFEWQGPESLRRWLFAIAEHLIRNAARKRGETTGSEPLRLIDPGPSPSRAMRREERFGRLQRSLAVLSPDHRQVIELARIQGLKISEIAARLGRSPGAVKQLLARALDRLRERFGDTESLSLPEQPSPPDDAIGPKRCGHD